MSKARDLANAGTALGAVTATELAYVDGVTSAIQTQIDAKEATLPSQTGNTGKYLTTDGSAKSWGTVSQYALPSQTGNSGKFLTTNGTAESWGTVTTPIVWTQRGASPNNQITKIEYNGTNLYVAVGGSGVLYSSPDGLTWTSRTSGFGSDLISDVAFGNGIWVIVGAGGKLSTSTDGITWTARTANFSTNDFLSVTYANSLFVATGDGGGTVNTGGLTYSTDGITWTRKSQSITIGQAYRSPVWNGTNWIIGSTLSTNNYIYATTPGGTWTAGTTGSAGTIFKIVWDGTRHTTYEGNNYDARYSTSLTLGTTTSMTGAHKGSSARQGSYYYYNNKIHLVSGSYYATYTPGSSINVTQSAPTLAPSRLDSASPWLADSQSSVWVGSVGIIIAGNTGIYTSF